VSRAARKKSAPAPTAVEDAGAGAVEETSEPTAQTDVGNAVEAATPAAADGRTESILEETAPPPPNEAVEAETRRDRKWRRRKKARPEELITAALQLFAEQGFAKTSLKDVGKKAGVSKATVYLYFKNKEDLLLAAVQKSVVPILDFADDYEIDSDAPASEMIRSLVHRWIDEFAACSAEGLPKLVVAEAGNFPALGQLYVDAVLQRARRLFQRIIKRGIEAGEFRAVDVREVVHVLLAPLLHAQVHSASLGAYDPAFPEVHAFLDTHIDLFLAAIAA
jgi:AcrR family transcriptional regulator